jgi:hypothetical protein
LANGFPGAGGAGGGGRGAKGGGNTSFDLAFAGIVNTGGGGGAGTNNTLRPANGGSGIVVIAYPGAQRGSGGNTVTTANGKSIHVFTSPGTYTA